MKTALTLCLPAVLNSASATIPPHIIVLLADNMGMGEKLLPLTVIPDGKKANKIRARP
ncbi:hypothetical protein PDESU_01999 [Pontiella desulfatans]|uniref:Arylsulfatase n=1 Tax=Pontiella desulfatans TaxID=2750659 RepID=A0A6C2U0J3_PONDE|nr:hypothetical protein [Pontiella desulfatans]VGO13442.1 hypothetical protein PDESU_01999 [Pontiella desulfatans]